LIPLRKAYVLPVTVCIFFGVLGFAVLQVWFCSSLFLPYLPCSLFAMLIASDIGFSFVSGKCSPLLQSSTGSQLGTD